MATYELIASYTAPSDGITSIDFSSIPSTFTDIKLVYSTRHSGSSNANAMHLTLSSATTGYTVRFLEGYGSGVDAATTSSRYGGIDNGNSSSSGLFANGEIYIPNYTSSNYKAFSGDVVTEDNATVGVQWLVAGLWSDTAAISSISIKPDNSSNTYKQYSSAYLYGIKNS